MKFKIEVRKQENPFTKAGRFFAYSKADFIINTTKENIKSTDVNKICGECKAKYQQM